MTTKHEQIREHYRAIRNATSSVWGSGSQARVKSIQRYLDAIKKLLEPDETLGASVLQLTNICNELGRENALLHNDLTEMTLNFNAAEKHAASLKQDLEQAQRDATALKRDFAIRTRQLKRSEACLKRVRDNLERSKAWL